MADEKVPQITAVRQNFSFDENFAVV